MYAVIYTKLFIYIKKFSIIFFLQGHTVFDLADKDMLKLLEELKKKQTTVRNYLNSLLFYHTIKIHENLCPYKLAFLGQGS